MVPRMPASRPVRRAVLLLSSLVLTVVGVACTAPSSPGPGSEGTELVLAEAYEDETLHPLMGYAWTGPRRSSTGW